jgi:hypothetical protein
MKNTQGAKRMLAEKHQKANDGYLKFFLAVGGILILLSVLVTLTASQEQALLDQGTVTCPSQYDKPMNALDVCPVTQCHTETTSYPGGDDFIYCEQTGQVNTIEGQREINQKNINVSRESAPWLYSVGSLMCTICIGILFYLYWSKKENLIT